MLDPLIGRTLGERFVPTRICARGATGVLYEANDPRGRVPIVIKAARDDMPLGHLGLELIEREARVLRRLPSPPFPALEGEGACELDAPRDPALPIVRVGWLAMRAIAGDPLATWAAARGPHVPIPAVLRVATLLSNALGIAHDADVVHADLKPAHVHVVETSGRVTEIGIVDLGSAVIDGAPPPRNAPMGTPRYQAPEAARGHAEPRSDLYGLGCIVFELFTGALTHRPRAPERMRELHSDARGVELALGRVEAGRDAAPPALIELVIQLLAADPGDRPPSARAVESALRSIAAASSAPSD